MADRSTQSDDVPGKKCDKRAVPVVDLFLKRSSPERGVVLVYYNIIGGV